MPWRNAPGIFFRGTGLPTVMRKNKPLVPRSNFGGECAQEPPPCSAVKHCRFLGTGGGGAPSSRAWDSKGMAGLVVLMACISQTWW